MQTRPFFLLCSILISCLGCGDGRPTRVPVSGQVLIDGKPVEHGTIQVVPDGARTAMGNLGADGRFELWTFDEEQKDGCVLGKHKVAIIANETVDAQSQRWHAPKKYMSPETSELTVEITEPTDDLTINLTWDGKEPWVEYFNKE